MNKKSFTIVAIIVGLFLFGGGVMAYTKSQNQKEQQKMAMEKKSSDEAMMKKQESSTMKDDTMKMDDKSMNHDATMSTHGSYVSRAEYDADPAKYADSKKVYFFHASWCSICQGIDKEIRADMTKIAAGVTLIKTDFDTSTDLRQKYGVTTQYTFVQVDSNGNETAQWSATSMQKAIEGVRS